MGNITEGEKGLVLDKINALRESEYDRDQLKTADLEGEIDDEACEVLISDLRSCYVSQDERFMLKFESAIADEFQSYDIFKSAQYSRLKKVKDILDATIN